MNAKMRELVASMVEASTLTSNLAEILDLGFVERGGCTLLAAEANKTAHVPRMNATENECFVNHVHIADFPIALLFARELTAALRRTFQERFVIILSFDDNHATVRFHKDKPGNDWLDVSKLENFNDEAVGVISSV